MRNFNRDRRPSRNSDRTMYQTICSQCGNECQVPFQPTSGKPVFCSQCFEQKSGMEPRRSDRMNSRRSSFNDRRMFDAVCDQCGENCQVPFQPTSGKPVFCNKCFEGKNDRGRNTESYKEQFVVLNNKLDKILRILEPVIAKEEVKEVPPVKKKKKTILSKTK